MNKNIKILIITSRADYGGGPQHILKLIQNLPSDFSVFIASPKEEPYYSKFSEVIGENNLINIPHRKFQGKAVIRLIYFCVKNKIDLIHSHGKGAGIYSRIISALTNRKCIHTFHGIHIPRESTLSKLIYFLIERILSIFTNRAIAVSNGERETVEALRLVPQSKLCVIENGVDFPEQINSDYNYHKPFRIVSVTRFDYSKNTELVIQIADELKERGLLQDFEFHLIGSGESENMIKNEITKRKYNSHFVFHGFQEDVIPFYKMAFVYLSTSRWEGLPLALLEAMSFGVPVIATNVRGNKDAVIHNLTGFLYEENSISKSVEYLLQLQQKKDLWLSQSIASRERVKNNFTVKRMAELTEKLYFSIHN